MQDKKNRDIVDSRHSDSLFYNHKEFLLEK